MSLDFLPDENYLFDLGIRSQGEGDEAESWMRIRDEMRNPWGSVHAGLGVVLVDAVTGRLAVRAALPDLVATSHISIQMGCTAREGVLHARARVLRRGRSTVALETRLEEDATGGGERREVGFGCATFSIVPNTGPPELSERIAALGTGVIEMGGPDARLGAPFLSRIGLRVVDAVCGVIEVDHSPYLQNHLKALQGGIVGTLVQAAAEESATAASGEPRVAMDISVQYLALGRVGPFRTRTRVLRHGAHGAAVRVELVDAGAGDKVLALAGVHCEPPPGA
ncbi:MAG: PaaI family thioesterase [Myxococcota bacterium]